MKKHVQCNFINNKLHFFKQTWIQDSAVDYSCMMYLSLEFPHFLCHLSHDFLILFITVHISTADIVILITYEHVADYSPRSANGSRALLSRFGVLALRGIDGPAGVRLGPWGRENPSHPPSKFVGWDPVMWFEVKLGTEFWKENQTHRNRRQLCNCILQY